MKAGTVLREFKAGDGRKVTLRTPRWEDLDDMLEFINLLVEEEAMIAVDTKKTREEEVDWLARNLTNLEKGRLIAVVAEADGRVVGSCEVAPKFGRMSHVGSLGISVKQGYREIGVGQEIMREVERHVAALGLEKIMLEVFAINDRAIHVYEKMGYVEVGRVPGEVKYRGGYVDSLIMVKELYAS
ncbi:GNAT family N-acetyltransferase [Candidatus Bathyarchaeota archaeon]|nr:GNAT family N-acetyltransferase [Candidatus Bathyarchaeota archaeon]